MVNYIYSLHHSKDNYKKTKTRRADTLISAVIFNERIENSGSSLS